MIIRVYSECLTWLARHSRIWRKLRVVKKSRQTTHREKRMPHERPRRLAHLSSPSFHTSPAPSTNGAFIPNEWQEPRHVGGGLAVARVHEQRSRNYHERRWPVRHSALGSFLSMDALLGAAARTMADHCSPDWRARTEADTQRTVYAWAPLQVRRGGRTTSSMSCNTNVSKLLVRWASDTYIWCLLPQLLWCMPLHEMFPLPTTSC